MTESFLSSYPANVRRMNRKALEMRSIALYEQAAELLSRAGRASEATVLLQKVASIRRWAAWHYLQVLTMLCPKAPPALR